MPVHAANDDQLRHLIYSNEYTVVKYTSPTCDICKSLTPFYQQFSERGDFKNVLFLHIDADENPLARQFLAERATPLMVTYHNGIVLEANTVYNVEDMTRMLEKLLHASD
ncbi:MAG: thioredoxin family protein [Bacteroidota bacterium]